MLQLCFPGFEKFLSEVQLEEDIHEPEKAVHYFENKGYNYLLDWAEEKPYIPYRILMSSGIILDEIELFEKLATTPLKDKSRGELQEAFYYFWAINHEYTSEKIRYNFRSTFVDQKDEKQAIEKYSKTPFYN